MTKPFLASRYDEGPDVPEAIVALIDAIRDYLYADWVLREELSMGGTLSKADCEKANARLQPFRLILKELETWEVDPTLGGRLPHPRTKG